MTLLDLNEHPEEPAQWKQQKCVVSLILLVCPQSLVLHTMKSSDLLEMIFMFPV